MKVLSIGNSFSQDAHRYIHAVSKSYGKEIYTVNLYIGGCCLERHVSNIDSGVADYDYEVNGENTGRKVSLEEGLKAEEWDIITLQQCSAFSGRVPTYLPYMPRLAEYVRKVCPKAKIYIHQTWAYEEGCEMVKGTAGFDSAEEMLYAVRNAYNLMAKLIKADAIIPCGKGMRYLDKEGAKAYRDTYHASLGVGRYTLALIWYGFLTGEELTDNDFNAFDEEVSSMEKLQALAAAQHALKRQQE